MRRTSLALVSCLIAGCIQDAAATRSRGPFYDGDAGAPDQEPLSFRRDIAPMFVGKCTMCHHPDNATGLDLTRPFDAEVGMIGRMSIWPKARAKRIVDPGEPENSFMLVKVRESSLDADIEGAPMPLAFADLSASDIQTVRDWITDGAKDDKTYRDQVREIFGDGVSLGPKGGSCGFCHYGGTSIPDLTDPFSKRGVVGRANSRGYALIDPGYPDNSLVVQKIEGRVAAGLSMPLRLESFSRHEVDLLERWIAEGAEDN
jgi:hypothetical protein